MCGIVWLLHRHTCESPIVSHCFWNLVKGYRIFVSPLSLARVWSMTAGCQDRFSSLRLRTRLQSFEDAHRQPPRLEELGFTDVSALQIEGTGRSTLVPRPMEGPRLLSTKQLCHVTADSERCCHLAEVG